MSIYKESSLYILGEILSKIFPLLLLPYLTRRLGLEGFGTLSYYQTYIALAVIFIGLSQEGAVARYFYAYGHKNIRIIMISGVIFSVLVSFILLISILLMFSMVYFYIVLISLFQVLISAQLSLKQCQKKAGQYTIIQISSTLLSFLLTVILFEMMESNVLNRLNAVLFTNMIIYFGIFSLVFFSDKVLFRLTFIRLYLGVKYIVFFGFPLILHNLSFFTKGQLDRLYIYKIFTAEQLGVYTSGFQIASSVLVILLAINKATIPYLFKGLKSGQIEFIKIKFFFLKSFIIIPIIAFIIMLVPEAFFEFILGFKYEGIKKIILLFCIGNAFSLPYFVLVNYLFYHAKNIMIAISTTISSVIYIVCVFLIAPYGLTNIPIALSVSNISCLIMLYYFSNRISQILK